MNKIFFNSLSFLLIILYGCTFEPGGEHFVELESTGKLPVIEVDLNLATDTIYIQKNEWLNFSYKTNGDQVNWAQFTIAGKETSQFADKPGGIELRWYFEGKETGTFPMEMKIFTRSQTGSIGDKVGAEGFLIAHTWTLIIKDWYEMGVKMDKVEFVDGSLKVSWEIFKGMDFKSYKIYREMDYVQQNKVLVATINSQQQTSYIDNNYHGEPSRYFVITNDEFYGSSIAVSGPLPELTARNNSSGDIELTWKKPPFYKNLKGYRVSFRDENGLFQQIAEINNSEVESFIIPTPRFAYNYEFYLTMNPLSTNFYEEWTLHSFLSSKAKATYGISTPKFFSAQSGFAPISYLKYDPEGILVFDHQKFTATKTIKHELQILNFDVSSNNKYMVSMTFSSNTIYFDDLENESKSKTLNLLPSFPHLEYSVSVSDLGTGIIFNDQTAILYDYLSESKLGEIQLGYQGPSYNIISPSGRFFFCITWGGGEYYQYKDKQIVRLSGFNDKDGNYLHSDYLPGENEKFIRTFSNRIEIVDCATWTIEKLWLFPDPISEFYNLDLKSGKLFLRQANQLILFDVMNGSKEELISTGNSNSMYAAPFYNSGQILWGEGKGIDLTKK